MKMCNSKYSIIFYFLLFFFAFDLVARAVAQEKPQPEKRYVRWRLIEVARKSLADSILVQLQQGKSFQKLAHQHSLHASAKEGGEIGWTALDSVDSDFKAAIATLPIGGTSAILQRGNHFFVLYKMNELAKSGYLQWKEQKSQADSLLNKIESLLNTGNSPAAMALIKETEERVKQIEDEGIYLRMLNFKGTALTRLSQFREAASLFDLMLKVSRINGDNYWEDVALGNLGIAYRQLSQYKRAITYYDSALVIARAIGDRKYEGRWLGNLGSAYSFLDQYQRAISYYDSALVIARAIGDRAGEGMWLGNLGNPYYLLGEYQQAIAYYDSAMGIARAIGDRSGVERHLGNMGLAYSSLGQIHRAIAYYDSALGIAREISDRKGEGSGLGMLGSAYNSLGQYHRAIAYYDSALSIARKIGDRQGEGEQLGNLCTPYLWLGEYPKAIAYYDSALVIARKIDDRRGEGRCLSHLGIAYVSLGQYHQAIAYYDSALVIARKIGDRPGEGIWLGYLGDAYYSLGQYPQAIAYYDSALGIARKIGDRSSEGIWLGGLGTVYHSFGQYHQVIAYADSALLIATEIGNAESIWQQYWSLAKANSKMPESKTNEVINFYDNAVNALENITGQLIQDVHKLSFLENKQELYHDYINYLMTQAENPHHERALEISEVSRTRALRDLLQGQSIQAPFAVEKRVAATKRTEELFQKFANAQIARAKFSDALRAGVDDSLETWATKILIPPDTLGSTEGAPAIRMREIQAEAKSSTLLEYHVLDDGVAIWVVSQSGKIFSFKQNIPKAKLQALIDSARQVLGVGSFSFRNVKPTTSGKKAETLAYKSLLQTLDSLLIQAVVRYLPSDSSRELIILPQSGKSKSSHSQTPLRTGRDSFPSYGSSTSKASPFRGNTQQLHFELRFALKQLLGLHLQRRFLVPISSASMPVSTVGVGAF